MTQEKQVKRVKKILREKARAIFEAGRYNMQMLQHCIDEYFKEKNEAEEARKKANEPEEDEDDEEGWLDRALNKVGSFAGNMNHKGKMYGLGLFALFAILMMFSMGIYFFFPDLIM